MCSDVKIALSPLKVDEWPETDRRLWQAARTSGGLFDDAGLASGWRPATIQGVERGYGLYLSWLQVPEGLEADVRPIARVSEAQIRSFMEAYAPGRSELTLASVIRGVAYVVRATAPPDGLPWLTRLAHRLTNTATPLRPKPPRMAPIADLIGLGRHLMGEGVAALRQNQINGAQVFRDGLMVAALAVRPSLRRRGLAVLRIGETFLIDPAGVHVRFSGKETKTGRVEEFTYPSWLDELFALYLKQARPQLLARSKDDDDGSLWIGRRGRPLTEHDISVRISTVTLQHLGKRVSPHLFRDCAATDIAIHDPAHVGITKCVLGHATLASSQKFYNQARSFSALQRLQAVINEKREATEPGNGRMGDE